MTQHQMLVPWENEFAVSLVSQFYEDSEELEGTLADAYVQGLQSELPLAERNRLLSAQLPPHPQQAPAPFPSPPQSPQSLPHPLTGHLVPRFAQQHSFQQYEQQQEQVLSFFTVSPLPSQPAPLLQLQLDREKTCQEWSPVNSPVPAEGQPQQLSALSETYAVQDDCWLAQQELEAAQIACTEARQLCEAAKQDPGMHECVWTYNDEQLLPQGPFSLSHIQIVSVECGLNLDTDRRCLCPDCSDALGCSKGASNQITIIYILLDGPQNLGQAVP